MHPSVGSWLPVIKVKSRSRWQWVWYGTLMASVATFFIIWCDAIWPNRYMVPAIFGEAVFQVETAEKMVALTFDDGPDPRYTEEISQMLLDAGAKGTFFVMGRHAQQHPEIVQRLIQQGHELGNHTWNHHKLEFQSPRFIRQELETTDQLLHQLGYQDPILFRAPYGASLFALPYVLRQRQQANILWTVQVNDWKPETPAAMMALLEPAFKAGAIILLHDADGTSRGADRRNTVQLVKQILAKYGAAGYQFVTVSELLAHGRAQNHL